MTKVCVKCGSCESSPRGDCRPCKREYDREYRANNKEKVSQSKKNAYLKKPEHYIEKSKLSYERDKELISEKSKVYREANRQRILDAKKKYRVENKEKIATLQKISYEKNRQNILKRQKDYVQKNKEKHDAVQREYRVRHAERLAERSREWLKNNKERAAERHKKYYSNNPEIFANSRTVRRSREASGKLSQGLFTKLLQEQGGKCPGCLTEINQTTLHVDHYFPLSLGGKHEDANIQLLCATCNLRKHATHPLKWLQTITL